MKTSALPLQADEDRGQNAVVRGNQSATLGKLSLVQLDHQNVLISLAPLEKPTTVPSQSSPGLSKVHR